LLRLTWNRSAAFRPETAAPARRFPAFVRKNVGDRRCRICLQLFIAALGNGFGVMTARSLTPNMPAALAWETPWRRTGAVPASGGMLATAAAASTREICAGASFPSLSGCSVSDRSRLGDRHLAAHR
jgi:hypothetical protein